jgi:hypothetical protein
MHSDDAPKTVQLDLENNPEHAKRACEVIRKLSDAELSQGKASPSAFVDRVPGFTGLHARTKAGEILVQFAKDEQQRRRDVAAERRFQTTDRRAKASLTVSVVALIVAIIAIWVQSTS